LKKLDCGGCIKVALFSGHGGNKEVAAMFCYVYRQNNPYFAPSKKALTRSWRGFYICQ
jgi:hypothetical protein